MEHLNDRQLFEVLEQGNKEALSELFLRHYDHLLHYGIRVMGDRSQVEEAIQDLFVHLLESSDRYGEVIYVKAYLFKSLRNRLLRHLRHTERRKIRESGWRDNSIDITFHQGDLKNGESEQFEIRKLLLESLNALPWRQRESVYLRYYNGLSTREIAEIMGVANQTVLNTLYQALKKMRKFERLQNFIGYLLPWLLICFSVC